MSAPAAERERAAVCAPLTELVVCSLEPWGEVRRRNQLLVDQLLRLRGGLRVLFVEPPADPLFDLAQRSAPQRPRRRAIGADGRLEVIRPLKPLPRRAGSFSDRHLARSVLRAARRARLRRPVLWINDLTYAPLIAMTGWPAVYDVTDDWLLAPFAAAEIDRLRGLEAVALREANEIVVCSPALAESRGAARPVSVIPNGVDAEHLRRERERPADLPAAPVAVYAGTLHESRLDIDLLLALAAALPQLTLALVGPDALSRESRRRLAAAANIELLGPRPYAELPGYLQHADLLIVPHLVSPFTESLDPIKAYECLVVGTPTVATPVAGFRELAGELTVVPAADFPAAVAAVLADPPPRRTPAGAVASWAELGERFLAVLERAADDAREDL
jgi:glycosyltransferase involved in cell wall biosynthesis